MRNTSKRLRHFLVWCAFLSGRFTVTGDDFRYTTSKNLEAILVQAEGAGTRSLTRTDRSEICVSDWITRGKIT